MNPKITTLLIISLIATSFTNYSTAQTAPHKSKKGVPSTIKAKASTSDIPMVFVQGGSFSMGSSDDQDDAAKPMHRVTVSSFYMGKYEVTQAQWKAIMGNNPSEYENCDECPVEHVSWDDVQGFIEKLNQRTGKHYRLPTEAEWEYAARGGTKSNNYAYSGSNNINDVGWYEKNSKQRTHPIGQKRANELGIYDMTGNVVEWCQDWHGETYYTNSPNDNPPGPSSGSYRVVRGGSWINPAQFCRVASRSSQPGGDGYVGFRLALVP